MSTFPQLTTVEFLLLKSVFTLSTITLSNHLTVLICEYRHCRRNIGCSTTSELFIRTNSFTNNAALLDWQARWPIKRDIWSFREKKVWITYGIPNIHTKFCSLAWSWNLRVWQIFSHASIPHRLQYILGVDLIRSSAVYWNVVCPFKKKYFCISLLISILPTQNLLLPILL